MSNVNDMFMTGKLIMQAASKHLTGFTLECGGKSPTYVIFIKQVIQILIYFECKLKHI